MSSLLIANARLLDPARDFDSIGHLGIRDGRIAYAGKAAPKEKFAETLDAKGLWLMPGIVDLAARFREPGQTTKATIASETRAAQAAGITAIVLPPDTSPVIDSPAVVDRIHGKAQAAGGLDIHVLGALTKGLAGEALAEMSALKQAGCIGVSNAAFGLRDSLMGRRALEYAQGLGLTVHVFPQNPALANGGCAHEGPVGTRLGLPPIPEAAEVSAIRFWITLVEDTGARVHFGRLSTARGAALVETAQKRGLPVTADVAAHQLFLIDEDVEGFNAMCHVIPPLRSADDRAALREAVRSGVIGAICSDHQPHEADAKINPFPLTEPGISALETLLPLTLRLVHEKLLTPLQAAERLALTPATVAGIAAGTLATGASADLTLIDPATRWTLQPAAMVSAGRNTPFAGQAFTGRAVRTVHRGRTVHAR
ncbi:MAG: dihydroorotase [Nevskiaceae bacterium]|nr:MAG: dihydroorotase [Nevskiaceae bacterium]